MKRAAWLPLICLLGLPFRAVTEPPQPDTRPPAIANFEDAVTDLAARVRPSLVQIVSNAVIEDTPGSTTAFFVANEYSGMVLRADGYVVTVADAVQGAQTITIILHDQSSFPATVVGIDSATNLAVVKFEPGDSQLTPAVLADSDTVRPGNFVLALGNPFGLEASVAHGIVSGTRRSVGGGLASYTGLLQITAPINPGDAGGIAVNSRGEVIGILSSTFQRASAFDDWDAIFEEFSQGIDWKELIEKVRDPKTEGAALPKDLRELIEKLMEDRRRQLRKTYGKGGRQRLGTQISAEGINFVTSSNVVKKVSAALIQHGKVERGFLGIMVQPLDAALRKQLNIPAGKGVMVVHVSEGTPAAEAGLQFGDVVLALGEEEIRDVEGLKEAVTSRPGATVTIRLVRKAEELKVSVTLKK